MVLSHVGLAQKRLATGFAASGLLRVPIVPRQVVRTLPNRLREFEAGTMRTPLSIVVTTGLLCMITAASGCQTSVEHWLSVEGDTDPVRRCVRWARDIN